jgi:hypothetical protein
MRGVYTMGREIASGKVWHDEWPAGVGPVFAALERLEAFTFRFNRIRRLPFLFDTLSSREPASPSLKDVF